MKQGRFDFKNLFEQSLIVFPIAVLLFSVALFVRFVQSTDISWMIAAILVPYVLPLLCFRLVNLVAPLKSGVSFIAERGYSPWLGAYKFQLIYLHLPFLERILRLVPGLFSFWLRLWGSQIGKWVYWTPEVTILDRTHLKIGNHVIFGHSVQMTSHAIKPKNNRVFLYLNDITIGDGCFIGAWSRLAPGVNIPAGTTVKVATDLYPNEKAVSP
ncbi:acyltransferase [Bdellovibrio sp. HCB337]|uniref:acyltransferase n=1 Tax=Bdellovibrio sp. HCB337 TaxID=3394358 RepID=UPI0039A6E18F